MSVASVEIRKLSALAGPVIVTQVTTMLLGVVDILMVGHVGVDALAAASLGRTWVWGTLLLGLGLVLGMDPVVTQAHGARDALRLGRGLQQGIAMAVTASMPIALLWAFTGPALRFLGQDAELAVMAQGYVVVQIPGAAPFLVFIALRQYLQGRGIVRPAMWIALSANVLNVISNWALIYGHLGLPAMGLVGAGIATTLTRVYMVGALVTVVIRYRLHDGGWTPWKLENVRLSGLREIAFYGGPVAIQLALEAWAFQLATLLAGRLGSAELAAHTVALNLASLTFMFPLGLSFATVTRVGNLIGAGQPRRAQTAAWVALGMGAGLMTMGAVLFIAGRFLLPRAYNSDPTVLALAAAVLPVAAAFQIFDGIQVVGSGILRGMGQPRPAVAIHLAGFWGLALPLSWWLTFHRGAGLVGIWWGLCLGLASVATLLVAWVAWRGPAHAVPVQSPADVESRR